LFSRNEVRRSLLTAALAFAVGLWAQEGVPQPVAVPIRLQAELLAKVAAYDRNFAARAQGRVRVLVVIKADNAESERLGEQILAELDVLKEIGGLPHEQELVRYTSAQALVDACKSRGATVVYFSAAFEAQMEQIAEALSGVSTLSVAVTPSYVEKRAVLGFDIESGRPKLVVHLGQARRQLVAFKPELLVLARVIQ
jgi:hypothetical protein